MLRKWGGKSKARWSLTLDFAVVSFQRNYTEKFTFSNFTISSNFHPSNTGTTFWQQRPHTVPTSYYSTNLLPKLGSIPEMVKSPQHTAKLIQRYQVLWVEQSQGRGNSILNESVVQSHPRFIPSPLLASFFFLQIYRSVVKTENSVTNMVPKTRSTRTRYSTMGTRDWKELTVDNALPSLRIAFFKSFFWTLKSSLHDFFFSSIWRTDPGH